LTLFRRVSLALLAQLADFSFELSQSSLDLSRFPGALLFRFRRLPTSFSFRSRPIARALCRLIFCQSDAG
jgi:hypothetical protein